MTKLLQEVGRVLSSKNEQAIRDAIAVLEDVLESIGAPTEDEMEPDAAADAAKESVSEADTPKDAQGFTAADYAQHLMELKKKVPASGFTIAAVVEKKLHEFVSPEIIVQEAKDEDRLPR